MGCQQSGGQQDQYKDQYKQAPEPASGAGARDMERGGPEETQPLKQEDQQESEPSPAPAPVVEEPKLVEAAQPLLAVSKNKETQKIIDKITSGEDFEQNRWRCLEAPDRAYYTLSAFAQLELQIVEARKLIPSVSSSFEKYVGDEPDAFVKVYVDDCFKYSSKCINNNRSPQWNDQCQKFDIVAGRCMVRLHVYDSDSNDNSTLIDPLGFVEFCVGDMPFDEEIDGWLELRFPANLQGTNLDRYFCHSEKREEDFKHAQPTNPGHEEPDVETGAEVNEYKSYLSVKEQQKIPASLATRAFKRIRNGANAFVSMVANTEFAKSGDEVQYNAGEIRVKMRLVKVVDDSVANFAMGLTPAYFTYASFVQEEFLPKMELQELVDDLFDIKIKLFDDMLFAAVAFVSYILAWRSWYLSGLLLLNVVCCAKSALLAYGVWHLWLASVLIMAYVQDWRAEMTSSGLNAHLDQRGLEMVAAWNDTSEMHNFVVRVVNAHLGTILSMQDLVHFSGTVARGTDGKVDITYAELVKAMGDVWFLDLPDKAIVEKGTLVRVNERRRGTVAKISGEPPDKVAFVAYDEPELGKDEEMMEETVNFHKVLPRIAVPSIPRMLVPKSVQGMVSLAMFQVNDLKETILPIVALIKDFMAWKRPVGMVLLIFYFLARAFLSFYGFYDQESWCYFIVLVLAGMRNGLLGLVVIALLFSRARVVRILKGLVQVCRSNAAARNAPECWKFYKAPNEPYKKTV